MSFFPAKNIPQFSMFVFFYKYYMSLQNDVLLLIVSFIGCYICLCLMDGIFFLK